MQPSYKVSLYVPCYNGAHFLSDTIQGILAQTYPVHEIFLVNDGSTDDSLKVASSFPNVTVISHQTNLGLSAARNTAIKNATGQLLAALDADTVPSPTWLEELIKIIDYSNTDGAGGYLIEKYTDTVADRFRAEVMAQHHGTSPGENLLIFGCNSIFKVDFVRKIGGYNEKFNASYDDVDFHTRFIQAGFKTSYAPNAKCFHSRKDTLQSVVDTAYRWRLPPFELKGAFESNAFLAAKWTTEIRASLQEIQEYFDSKAYHLLLPAYYGIFSSLVHDQLTLLKKHPTDTQKADLVATCALVFRAIGNIRSLTNKTKSFFITHIIHRFSNNIDLPTKEELSNLASICTSNNFNQTEFFGQFSIDFSKISPIIINVLWDIWVPLEVRPEISNHLDAYSDLVLKQEAT